MTTSYTRTLTCEIYRAMKQGQKFDRANANTLREALRLALAMHEDTRELTRKPHPWLDYRGNGNRWKRRAGWRLLKHYCHHMDGGYDCACEPQSWYYYAQP